MELGEHLKSQKFFQRDFMSFDMCLSLPERVQACLPYEMIEDILSCIRMSVFELFKSDHYKPLECSVDESGYVTAYTNG